MDTGSNTLRFANYLASGTGEDDAGTDMTEVSTSDLINTRSPLLRSGMLTFGPFLEEYLAEDW